MTGAISNELRQTHHHNDGSFPDLRATVSGLALCGRIWRCGSRCIGARRLEWSVATNSSDSVDTNHDSDTRFVPDRAEWFDAKHDDLVRTRHCVQRFRRYDVAGGHHFRVEHDVCRQKLK